MIKRTKIIHGETPIIRKLITSVYPSRTRSDSFSYVTKTNEDSGKENECLRANLLFIYSCIVFTNYQRAVILERSEVLAQSSQVVTNGRCSSGTRCTFMTSPAWKSAQIKHWNSVDMNANYQYCDSEDVHTKSNFCHILYFKMSA